MKRKMNRMKVQTKYYGHEARLAPLLYVFRIYQLINRFRENKKKNRFRASSGKT